MTTLGLAAEPPQAGAPTQNGQTTPATAMTSGNTAPGATAAAPQQGPASQANGAANGPTQNGTSGRLGDAVGPLAGQAGPGPAAERWQHIDGGLKKPPYTVNPDVQTNKIFIGGVPAEASKRDVRTTFLKFGQIKEALLPRDPRDRGRHRGFAFISFEEAESVNAVLEDGPKVHKVCGKLVECKRAIPHPTKGIVTGAACRRLRSADHRIIPAEFEAGYKNNLYVTGLPADITKKDIEELFGAMGEILSTKLGRLAEKESVEGKHRTAFVAFLEDSSAAKAMRELNSKKVKGTVLNVTYAYHVTRHPRKPKYHPNSKKNGMVSHDGRGFNGKWGWSAVNGYDNGGRGRKFKQGRFGHPNGHGPLPPMYYNVMIPPHHNGKRKKPKSSLPEIPHVDPLSRPGASRNKPSNEGNFSFSAEKVMEAQLRLKQAHDTSLRQHPSDTWHLKSRSARGGHGKREAPNWQAFGKFNGHSNGVSNGQIYHQGMNGISRNFDMQQMPHPVMMPPTHVPNMPPYCASPQSYYYQPYPYSPQHSAFNRPSNYPSQPSYSIPDAGHQSQLSSSNNAMVQNSNGVYTFPSNGVNAGNGSATSSEHSPPQSPGPRPQPSQSPPEGAQHPSVAKQDELLQKLWALALQIIQRDPANKDLGWKQLRTVLKSEATSALGETLWKSANDVEDGGWTVLKRLKVRLRNRKAGVTKDRLSTKVPDDPARSEFYNETKEDA